MLKKDKSRRGPAIEPLDTVNESDGSTPTANGTLAHGTAANGTVTNGVLACSCMQNTICHGTSIMQQFPRQGCVRAAEAGCLMLVAHLLSDLRTGDVETGSMPPSARRLSTGDGPATPTLNQLMESRRSLGGFPESRRSVNPNGTAYSLGVESTGSGEVIPQGGKGMVRFGCVAIGCARCSQIWCCQLHVSKCKLLTPAGAALRPAQPHIPPPQLLCASHQGMLSGPSNVCAALC
jgi:hypothetical protein